MIGIRNSSNSNRLGEVGEQYGLSSYLIQDAEELDRAWFTETSQVAIIAGTSTPEVLVKRVLDSLRSFGVGSVQEMNGIQETMTFGSKGLVAPH